MKKGERYECKACGLVLSVEDVGTDDEYELSCCGAPMARAGGKKTAKRTTKKKDEA